MLTRAEKTYLALALAFLASGTGIRAWRRASVRLGPFPDAATAAQDSARAADSAASATASSAPTGSAAAGSDPAASAAVSAAGAPPDSSAMAASDPVAAPATSREDTRLDGSSVQGVTDPATVKGRSMPRAAESPGAGKTDLNRADAAALMRVKGIGAKTAEAIIAYRREHGPFRDLAELLRIKGIGEKKLEKLAPHLIL